MEIHQLETTGERSRHAIRLVTDVKRCTGQWSTRSVLLELTVTEIFRWPRCLRIRCPSTLGLKSQTLKRISRGFWYYPSAAVDCCSFSRRRTGVFVRQSLRNHLFGMRESVHGVCDVVSCDESLPPAKSAEVAMDVFPISVTGQSAQTLRPAEAGCGSVQCAEMWSGSFRAGSFYVVWNTQVVKCRRLPSRRIIGTTDNRSFAPTDSRYNETPECRCLCLAINQPVLGDTSYWRTS